MKVLCLNLWQGGNLMNEILSFLRKEDPDVLVMQEVYNGHDLLWERKFRSLDVLREELNYPYEHFAPAFLERTSFGKVEQGNAVLSKFPLLGSKTFFYDVPYGEREDLPPYYKTTPRNLQHVTLDVHGRMVHVFNTQGVWGEDGEDNDRRLFMGKKIAEAVQPYQDVVLAGDFNVQEKTKTIGMIEGQLVNVFKDERTTSFNMRHKTNPGYATAVVDFMFVSPNLNVKDKWSYDEDVSDHLALAVDIQL
ncbi:endonuclease/exonuclease/phosphatase family protein [Candidatus Uhrbacteria bacterium]|nr:endonuclease/exonuclease/phosphatase family protein [Candidatus Uhrbacteria bacterium]